MSTGHIVDKDACAHSLAAEIETMRSFSNAGDGVTRLSLTKSYIEALEHLESSFRDLDFRVWYDPVRNFIASNVNPGESCLAMGSHIDSVPNGGAFDGTAGVLCALEVARALPAMPLKIFSFICEEGSRFGSGLLGSRCVAGVVSADDLGKYTDPDGISFYDAASAAGFKPDQVAECGDNLRGVQAFLEIHIEQGRVLEEHGHDLGIVTNIVGLAHATLEIHGRADHAGATPMLLRSDAGITAAEVVLELERIATRASDTAVGTVGVIHFSPGAKNVIPGKAVLGIDVRDQRESVITEVLDDVRKYAEERAHSREQHISYRENLRTSPVPLNESMVSLLTQKAEALGLRYTQMVSGGGHDAMMLAKHVPTGMLFVPCRDGVSHSPQEHAEVGHLAAAVAVAAEALATVTI